MCLTQYSWSRIQVECNSTVCKNSKELPVAPQTVVTPCILYTWYRQLPVSMGQEKKKYHAPGVLTNKNDSDSEVVHVLVLSVRLLHFLNFHANRIASRIVTALWELLLPSPESCRWQAIWGMKFLALLTFPLTLCQRIRLKTCRLYQQIGARHLVYLANGKN